MAVYGHNFSDWFVVRMREWARKRNMRLVSIGYRNDWADTQWLTAGPEDFARFMADADGEFDPTYLHLESNQAAA